ncbi:hypothetical protein [Thalassotalea ganghwensis]
MSEFFVLAGGIIAMMVVMQVVANKFGLDVNGLFGSLEPVKGTNVDMLLSAKDKEIKALSERVAVLERLVTDPSEQLKREIEQLK